MKKEKHLTPIRAIRKFCIECTGSQKAPRNCDNTDCPLFPYRLGKNPRRKGIGNTKGKKHKRQTAIVIGGRVQRTKPLEFNVDGKKRIRLIVEDIE